MSEQPAQHESVTCDHHWVSTATPGLPIWVIQCSQCDAYDAETMAEEIAERERQAAAKALREAAEKIGAELVCCNVYAETQEAQSWDGHHAICYWGAASSSINRDRADEIEATP